MLPYVSNRRILMDDTISVSSVRIKTVSRRQIVPDEPVFEQPIPITEPVSEQRRYVVERKFNGDNIPITEPVSEQPIPITEPVSETPAVARFRTGNGHARAKVRNLTDREKGRIMNWFTERNGCIESDACVEFKRDFDEVVTIFQITGYVTKLHNDVASGAIALENMRSYLVFIEGHRALWARYNSPKYAAMRERLSTEGEGVSPRHEQESWPGDTVYRRPVMTAVPKKRR